MREEITIFVIYFIFVHISLTMGAIPGTFFWKPRLALDMNMPEQKEANITGIKPSLDNIREGKVVVFEGYQTGMTMLALSSAYSAGTDQYHLDPFSANFYTNSYRLPNWIAGNDGNYCETHKVWSRRFLHMDTLVPDWMQKILFFVKKEDWEKEKKELRLFQRYAEPTFGRYYRYPSKIFKDFASFKKSDSVYNYSSSGS